MQLGHFARLVMSWPEMPEMASHPVESELGGDHSLRYDVYDRA